MTSGKIYICNTYYHVLISLIKEISCNKEADIVVCDTIPDSDKLIETLSKCHVFKNVFTFSEKKCREEREKYNFSGKIGVLLWNHYYKKFIKPPFQFNKSTYREINIFNDTSYLGYYLRANKIYYNLLEDAKNSYKVLENYVNIDYHKSLINRIFGFAFETFYLYGKSKYAKMVEVNDDEGVKIPKEKLIVMNKEELFNNLTEKEKIEIYRIFMGDRIIDTVINENSVLILTQPLFDDSLVKSEKIQKKVYQDIIDTYCKNFHVVIKPHPRDNFRYEAEFKDITVMDKNLPTEILNFNNGIKYEKAITITSSSINALSFVENKLYLGFDWLKEYQK